MSWRVVLETPLGIIASNRPLISAEAAAIYADALADDPMAYAPRSDADSENESLALCRALERTEHQDRRSAIRIVEA